MIEMMRESTFFGFAISLLGFELGRVLQKRFKNPIFNPLLIGIIFVMIVIKAMGVTYEEYYSSAKYLGYFLTPATVCLSISLYRQVHVLKSHCIAIVGGVIVGIFTCMVCILIVSVAFGLTHSQYVTLLPKSITTAIGVAVSKEMGGIEAITTATIVATGIFGNIVARPVLKLFKITEPVAQGIAIGTASHAAGTAKAIEMGEVQGAMSGLAISVAGIVTVLLAQIFGILH